MIFEARAFRNQQSVTQTLFLSSIGRGPIYTKSYNQGLKLLLKQDLASINTQWSFGLETHKDKIKESEKNLKILKHI